MFWLIANNYVNKKVNKLSVLPTHPYKKHVQFRFILNRKGLIRLSCSIKSGALSGFQLNSIKLSNPNIFYRLVYLLLILMAHSMVLADAEDYDCKLESVTN